MTLDELRAKYPHGSRLTVPDEGSTVWRVVGWDVEHGDDAVLCRRETPDGSTAQKYETRGLFPHAIRTLVPCPITEPLKLVGTHGIRSSNGHLILLHGDLGLTLHPDGRYTWEGGPE
jgi:hypothetical protein